MKVEIELPVLRSAIEKTQGNVGQAARDLSVSVGVTISRQSIARRLRDAGLEEFAAELRAAAGIRGPRPSLLHGRIDAGAEEAAIREKLASTISRCAWSPDDAAAELGVSRRVLYRMMAKFGITAPWADPAHKARKREELVVQLAKGGFAPAAAAKAMKVSRTTIMRWMLALDVPEALLRLRKRSK